MRDGPARSRRYLWWLLGIAGATALVVSLYLGLLPVLLILNWANRADQMEQSEIDWQRQSATKVQVRLQAAAVDGELTAPEITKAVGKLWPIERTADEIRVPTSHHTAVPGCSLVVLTLPLGPATKSSLVNAPCPTESVPVPSTVSD